MKSSNIRKVCIVITARPSYSRIKTVLEAVKAHPALELKLIVSASALLERYGSVIDVIRADGFEPDEVVYMVVEGENLVTSAKSTGLGIVELTTAFDNIKPDMVLSIADRYETIATAISAAYLNIPVVHVQGGEVSGSIDEKVRHAVTKLSDLHFVSNTFAAERVIRMGENPETVHTTGCPSIDLVVETLENKDADFDVFSKYAGVGNIFDLKQGYLVVMQHPVTTECEDSMRQINETMSAIKELKMPTFWFWPNVDAGSDHIAKAIRQVRESSNLPFIYFLKNMEPVDFLRLLDGSLCLIGNSSAGIRESAYLGLPVVNIGNRQQGRDRAANVMDVGYDSAEIIRAVRDQLVNGRYQHDELYGDGKAGGRIADLMAKVPLTFEKRLTY